MKPVGYRIVDGKVQKDIKVVWFTNLDYAKRHTIPMLDLECKYYGNEDKYPVYDNYYAINVNKTKEIPCDYTGLMGVPITFIDRYHPEQFEIVGVFSHGTDGPLDLAITTINGVKTYKRLAIRYKESYIVSHSDQFKRSI